MGNLWSKRLCVEVTHPSKDAFSCCTGQCLLRLPVLQAENQTGDEGRSDVRRHVGSSQAIEAKDCVHQKQQRDQDQTLPQQGNEFETDRAEPS